MTKEEFLKWDRKIQLNSVYGNLTIYKSSGPIPVQKDQLSTALSNAWTQWPEIKGFRDWIKNDHGFEFEYSHHSQGRVAQVTKIHDEQKYAWFLLKWA